MKKLITLILTMFCILGLTGCGTEEIEAIVGFWRRGDLAQMKKRLAACRREQLDRLHEKQKCIDRLDYLCYRLEKEK